MSRPNILLLISDQHNADIAGHAGDPVVRTPTLDRLASEGIAFRRAYCQSPVCTPSRMSFLSGKHIGTIGCWNNHWPLPPEHRTFAHHFADAGYATCLVGKMHFGGADQMHGFQHRPYGDFRHGLGHQPDPIDMFPNSGGVAHATASQIPESLQQDVVVSTEAAAWVAEQRSAHPQQPWLLCASYCRPHAPLVAPARYLRYYRDQMQPTWLEERDEAARLPYPSQQRKNYGLLDITPEQNLRAREAYYGCVEMLDDCLGRLLRDLRETGSLENTVVVYFSDHGELLGNHGLWWKANYYEEAIRVPWIISGPGLPRGVVRDELAALVDLFPTLCALAGIEPPEDLEGVDLTPLLTADPVAKPPRDHVISEYYGIGMLTQPFRSGSRGDSMRLIRTERHKAVSLFELDDLCFDLEADPQEFHTIDTPPALHTRLYNDFAWEDILDRIDQDRQRLLKLQSGVKPSTPNQYRLSDGRIFDAEGDLYGARWLQTDTYGMSGIIPQRYG
jgi:choline-sulfatase